MTDLDELFARSRDLGPAPSQALTARVLADAAQVQAQVLAAQSVMRTVPRRSPGLGTWFMDMLGGAGVMTGVLSAGVAGLVLGYVQPAGLTDLGSLLTLATPAAPSLEMMPGLDALLTEE